MDGGGSSARSSPRSGNSRLERDIGEWSAGTSTSPRLSNSFRVPVTSSPIGRSSTFGSFAVVLPVDRVMVPPSALSRGAQWVIASRLGAVRSKPRSAVRGSYIVMVRRPDWCRRRCRRAFGELVAEHRRTGFRTAEGDELRVAQVESSRLGRATVVDHREELHPVAATTAQRPETVSSTDSGLDFVIAMSVREFMTTLLRSGRASAKHPDDRRRIRHRHRCDNRTTAEKN
jgi:hypothetical protein